MLDVEGHGPGRHRPLGAHARAEEAL